MFFASDNAGPVHPAIMEKLATANAGYALPYGNDPLMDEVRDKIRDIFEAPEAAVESSVLRFYFLNPYWQTRRPRRPAS